MRKYGAKRPRFLFGEVWGQTTFIFPLDGGGASDGFAIKREDENAGTIMLVEAVNFTYQWYSRAITG